MAVGEMVVDCSACTIRGDGCDGCVVTFLFGSTPTAEVPWHGPVAADAEGSDDVDRAIAVLAAAGMVAVTDAPARIALVGATPLRTRRRVG